MFQVDPDSLAISAFVVVYCIDKESTFRDAISIAKNLREKSEKLTIILVGAKSDLERRRVVSVEGGFCLVMFKLRKIFLNNI